MSKPCFQICRQQLQGNTEFVYRNLKCFQRGNFPGQGLVFKVALLSCLGMFSWNPLSLTVIFLAADSYFFYDTSTSLGQPSQGTRLFSVVTEKNRTFQVCLFMGDWVRPLAQWPWSKMTKNFLRLIGHWPREARPSTDVTKMCLRWFIKNVKKSSKIFCHRKRQTFLKKVQKDLKSILDMTNHRRERTRRARLGAHFSRTRLMTSIRRARFLFKQKVLV